MKIAMSIVGWTFFVVLVFGLVIPAYVNIDSDYVRKIVVDDSSKIELAISNAVDDVASRGFIVNNIDVKRSWLNKTFEVQCGGIERGNLLKQ